MILVAVHVVETFMHLIAQPAVVAQWPTFAAIAKCN
jgi:hypothetical protein